VFLLCFFPKGILDFIAHGSIIRVLRYFEDDLVANSLLELLGYEDANTDRQHSH